MINFYKNNRKRVLKFLKKIYFNIFLKDISKEGYYNHLKNLVFEFLITKYPDYKKEIFEKKIDYIINNKDFYLDLEEELDTLFNPNFNDNLEFHYKNYERKIFFRLISYSLNKKLITQKYTNIYDFGINEIKEPLNILEIGGGIPHGLIHNVWKKEKSFIKNFTYVDADLLHSEFIKWYCNKLDITSNIKLFKPSKTPVLDNIEFNFVFAKDVFEHLDAPEILIDYLIDNTTNNKTLLCLDLEHKGKKIGQHISPNLPILKERLIKNNFQVIKKFNELHVWKKK
tara:strand:+ start:121 stop:972 length:852 start_codon:yes stop_codon:yes gene_type:complete